MNFTPVRVRQWMDRTPEDHIIVRIPCCGAYDASRTRQIAVHSLVIAARLLSGEAAHCDMGRGGVGRARARPAFVIAAVAKYRSRPGIEWLSIGSHEFEKLEEIKEQSDRFRTRIRQELRL